MNDIQKFLHKRMLTALYAAQAELIENISSENANAYYVGRLDLNNTKEIFDSFIEFESMIFESIIEFNSSINTTLMFMNENSHKDRSGVFHKVS